LGRASEGTWGDASSQTPATHEAGALAPFERGMGGSAYANQTFYVKVVEATAQVFCYRQV